MRTVTREELRRVQCKCEMCADAIEDAFRECEVPDAAQIAISLALVMRAMARAPMTNDAAQVRVNTIKSLQNMIHFFTTQPTIVREPERTM